MDEDEKVGSKTDYVQPYDLESYLFNTVRKRFDAQHFLSAFDFFCIIVWKANRSKSNIAKHAKGRNLEDWVRELTAGIAGRSSPQERMRYLIEYCRFRLPMASAILTVLYPEEFTVYDVRVCGQLKEMIGEDYSRIGNSSHFNRIWDGYRRFKESVVRTAPQNLSLRDKDRYFWWKSLSEQLSKDIQRGFMKSRRP